MDYAYLEAKRKLDDRSLDRRVWSRFAEVARQRAAAHEGGFRIVEIGAGSGTMVERLHDWGFLPAVSRHVPVEYFAVEPQESLIPVLRDRLDASPEISTGTAYHGTVDEVMQERMHEADVLIAHAVLDLFPARRAAEIAARLVRPGGLLYASITFDGETFFEPEIDPTLDGQVRELYHRSMVRDEAGQTGFARKLLTALPAAGLNVDAVGSSDWIIRPQVTAGGTTGYPPGEQEFLESILSMVEASLRDEMPASERDRWLTARRGQLREGALIYIAHQLDMLALRP